jgi:hypothetical protein
VGDLAGLGEALAQHRREGEDHVGELGRVLGGGGDVDGAGRARRLAAAEQRLGRGDRPLHVLAGDLIEGVRDALKRVDEERGDHRVDDRAGDREPVARAEDRQLLDVVHELRAPRVGEQPRRRSIAGSPSAAPWPRNAR